MTSCHAASFFTEIWQALGGAPAATSAVTFTGQGDLPSVFPVTDLAAASVGAAGLAVAEFVFARSGRMPGLIVDRRLVSIWFATSLRPEGWSPPGAWDAIAGDYAASDTWIRLHTNAPAHRAAALSVLGVAGEKTAVTQAVAGWKADDLEAAIVAAGGCAATMRALEDWATHPQGRAVSAEPLLHRAAMGSGPKPIWPFDAKRPLAGIRVLDLTRVLAGPVATRFLAGYGADVLRLDPPFWDEPALAPEVTLGKRCAPLDLREPAGRAMLERLIAETDVLVHGYRPGALDASGFGAACRRGLNPTLIDVSLDAYGWTGPWRDRRGFDSLMQMSTGIADAGMRRLGRDRPTPLPVQALDQATGYLMAAAVLRGLTARLDTGAGLEARASLARTAALLVSGAPPSGEDIETETDADWDETVEQTAWGPARRVRAPLAIEGAPMHWDRPAGPLGAAQPLWQQVAP
jgi:hypothetical protein